ncbi:MAG: BCCT family transporter [Vampirovibrionales bacterium]
MIVESVVSVLQASLHYWQALPFSTQCYLLFANILCMAWCVMLCFPKSVKVGASQDTPAFGFWSWVLMLFQTGMGTGLLFWGGVEPQWHALHPPPLEASLTLPDALALTWFHWGVVPWVLYTLVALWLAKFLSPVTTQTLHTSETRMFSLGERCAMFWQILGNKLPVLSQNWQQVFVRYAVNVLVVWGVLMGVVATLCMGVLQWHASVFQTHLAEVGRVPWQVYGVLVGFCACFLASALSGIASGVKTLSWLTTILMLLLLAMVTLWLMQVPQDVQFLALWWHALVAWVMKSPAWMWGLPSSIFDPTHLMVQGTLLETRSAWVSEWTGKYWSWWLAWTPFVSQFLLTISKGRSVRSVAFFGVVIPTMFSMVWFAIFTLFALHVKLPLHHLTQAPAWTHQALGVLPFAGYARGILVTLIALGVINSLDAVVITLSELMGWYPRKRLTVLWTGCIIGLSVWAFYVGGLPLLQTLTLHHTLPYTLCIMAFMVLWLVQGKLSRVAPKFSLDKSHEMTSRGLPLAVSVAKSVKL